MSWATRLAYSRPLYRYTACVTSSGSPAVLMDEAAEAIFAHQFAARHHPQRSRRPGQSLVEPLMRPGPMVVLDESGEHALQVASAEDPEVVQTLLAGSAYEPLGDGVGVSFQLQLIGMIGDDFESSIRSIRWLVESSSCSATSRPGARNSVCSIEKLGASGHVRCRLLGL